MGVAFGILASVKAVTMNDGPRQFILAAIVGGALFTLAGPSPSAAQNGGPEMSIVDQAGRHLREFGRTKAPGALRHALLELEAVNAPRTPGSERDRVTNTWFSLFRALDGVKEPAFDPKDVPQLHILAPTVNGVTYPAGVNPAAITDPVARSKYAAALRENQAHSARFATGYALNDLDTRATGAFHRYRRRTYAATNGDTTDFARLLLHSGLTTVRKQLIRD